MESAAPKITSSGDPPVARTTGPPVAPAGPLILCRSCQNQKPAEAFDRAKNGKFGRKTICKTCQSEQRRKKISEEKRLAVVNAWAAGHRNVATIPAPDPEPCMETAARACISIDMTDYPDLHQAVLDISKSEFRTPEMQVLYWLNKNLSAIRGGAA